MIGERSARLGATLIGAIAPLLWATLALLTTYAQPLPAFELVAMTFAVAFLLVLGKWTLDAARGGPAVANRFRLPVRAWVIGVGGTDKNGRLAGFSSRGSFSSSLFHPTLVAPAVSLIGPRAVGVTGIVGLLGADLQRLTALELPWYTTASGTSGWSCTPPTRPSGCRRGTTTTP